jgi:hypothetical protein
MRRPRLVCAANVAFYARHCPDDLSALLAVDLVAGTVVLDRLTVEQAVLLCGTTYGAFLAAQRLTPEGRALVGARQVSLSEIAEAAESRPTLQLVA